MNNETGTLLVGLGSPFGDDQLGWRVVAAVEEQVPLGVTIKRARSAGEILDWLDGVDRLIVCDACHGAGPIGSIHRWRWPAAEIPPARFSGSHDLDLATVLTLAERLGHLPGEVTIWAIEGKPVSMEDSLPHSPLSAEVQAATPRVIESLISSLSSR